MALSNIVKASHAKYILKSKTTNASNELHLNLWTGCPGVLRLRNVAMVAKVIEEDAGEALPLFVEKSDTAVTELDLPTSEMEAIRIRLLIPKGNVFNDVVILSPS